MASRQRRNMFSLQNELGKREFVQKSCERRGGEGSSGRDSEDTTSSDDVMRLRNGRIKAQIEHFFEQDLGAQKTSWGSRFWILNSKSEFRIRIRFRILSKVHFTKKKFFFWQIFFLKIRDLIMIRVLIRVILIAEKQKKIFP